MSKSNEYGYIPQSPTQADGSNTGIFEVNDVVDLLNAGQWSLELTGLIHISTQIATGSTNYVDFTNIQNDTYTQQLFIFNGGGTTNGQHLDIRLSTNNCSTFYTSATHRKASIYGNNKTVNTNTSSATDTAYTYAVSSDNSSTTATAIGWYIFDNWLSTSKYDSAVGGYLGYNTNDTSIYRNQTLYTTTTLNAFNSFRVYANNASYNIIAGTTMSLYGVL
jgi:hypothetical protein